MNTLEARKKRLIAPNVGFVSSSNWMKLKVLFSAGMKLGFVLFVALTTSSVLNGSLKSVWAMWKEPMVRKEQAPRDLVIPRLRSTPTVQAQPLRREIVTARKPENVRDVIRESSYYLNDVDRFSRSLARFAR